MCVHVCLYIFSYLLTLWIKVISRKEYTPQCYMKDLSVVHNEVSALKIFLTIIIAS